MNAYKLKFVWMICVAIALFGCSDTPDAPPPEVRVLEEIQLLETDGMGSWKPMPLNGVGSVEVNDGVMNVGSGALLSGVVWAGDPPATMNYEIELEARKVYGFDFFLGLTVPVDDSHCTWVCGGWGGSVVGISSIDDVDAGANETSFDMDFEEGRWYRMKIRVLPDRIQCWIDDRRVIDADIKGRKISMRPGGIELTVPLGIATYDTEAEYRNIVWRKLATGGS